MAVSAPARSPVTAYAEAVVRSRVVANRLVRLACERHLRDLKSGAKRGLRFDEGRAERVMEFFPRFLRLAEGAHAGQAFELQPWQQFIIGSLFGWLGADGCRRFRKAYVECAKGNGKSPLSAGVGLYGLLADGEEGAEIYSAAVTRDQANILFRDAKRMVQASPALSGRIEVNVGSLTILPTNSFFRPVSSEARSLDGPRVHMGLIDELHEHRSSLVVDKVQAGTKGRRQPLVLEITNAGYDRLSVCWQHHDYSIKVLEGTLDNDEWFAFVAGLDEGDDWTDEKVWPKANPNLGVSVTLRYLREQVREALGMPGKQSIVKRLNFCVWTESAERWLDIAAWDGCGESFEPEDLRGQPCFGGLDLASTRDLTAFGLLFPRPDGRYVFRVRFWVPEDTVRQRVERDRVPYDVWVRDGLIETTPGNVTDYDRIRAAIKDDAERFTIREIAYDRWNATQLVTQLQEDGATMVPFGQGYFSMNAPSKELEKLVTAQTLVHGGNPVLRWMAGNVSIEQDPAGNIKPSRSKSMEKIDGIAALVMALGRAIVHRSEPDGESAYERRGIIFL